MAFNKYLISEYKSIKDFGYKIRLTVVFCLLKRYSYFQLFDSQFSLPPAHKKGV